MNSGVADPGYKSLQRVVSSDASPRQTLRPN